MKYSVATRLRFDATERLTSYAHESVVPYHLSELIPQQLKQ